MALAEEIRIRAEEAKLRAEEAKIRAEIERQRAMEVEVLQAHNLRAVIELAQANQSPHVPRHDSGAVAAAEER